MLIGAGRGTAKCPTIIVTLQGRVVGQPSGRHHVVITMSPEPNRAFGPVPIVEGRFSAKVPFDTTESAGRVSHDCSRRPAVVTLSLYEGERALDQVRFTIDRDFSRTDEGDYVMASDVTLHISR